MNLYRASAVWIQNPPTLPLPTFWSGAAIAVLCGPMSRALRFEVDYFGCILLEIAILLHANHRLYVIRQKQACPSESLTQRLQETLSLAYGGGALYFSVWPTEVNLAPCLRGPWRLPV